MSLFGPPNIEKMKARRDVRGLIRALGYREDANVRCAAVEALGELKQPQAVGPLITALKDQNSAVRYRAVVALQTFGDVRAVDPLLALLKDPDKNVRLAVVASLKRLGDSRSIKLLIGVLQDHEAEMSTAAMKALRVLAPRVVDLLISEFKPGGTIGRQQGVETLVKIGAPAVERLVKSLMDLDPNRAEAIAEALSRIGTPAIQPLVTAFKKAKDRDKPKIAEVLRKIGAPAVGPFIVELKDNDRRTREAAVAVLDQIGWQVSPDENGAHYWVAKRNYGKCVEIGKPAVEPLIAELTSNFGDLDSIAFALGEIGDERAIVPLIAQLKRRDGKIEELVKALVKIGKPAVDPLLAALRENNEYAVSSVIAILVKIGDPRAVEPLIAALKHYDPSTRSYAAGALGSIGDARAIGPLVAALYESYTGYQNAIWPTETYDKHAHGYWATLKSAAIALERLGWEPDKDENKALYYVGKQQWDECIQLGAPAVGPLIVALRIVSGEERAAIATALGRIGNARVTEPLLALLRDANVKVRWAAAGALEQVGWQPGPDEDGAFYWITKQGWEECKAIGAPAIQPLLAAIKDNNENVRRAAIEAVKELYKDSRLGEADKKSILAKVPGASPVTYSHGDWDSQRPAPSPETCEN